MKYKHELNFISIFRFLVETCGRPALWGIFFKDFTVQMTYGCTTLNKLHAVGRETSKSYVSIALSTVCRNHLIKKVGAHAQPGHIWRAFSEVTVTSCTVLRSSNAAGCAHQVLSSIYLTTYRHMQK